MALTVSPSFEMGFGVEISVRRDPLRGDYYVVKTKGLDVDSYVRVQNQNEIFGRIVTEQELDAEDSVKLSKLVTDVVVSPPEEEWSYMDGTLLALSIERGATLISIEWNSAEDGKWRGVDELVGFLTGIYGRYRRLRG